MTTYLSRRTFLAGSLGATTALALDLPSLLARSAPATQAELPQLTITLTDTDFAIDPPLTAGRFAVTVKNIGTSAASHFALGRIPEGITDAQYQEWLHSLGTEHERTDILAWEDIAFVGVPDWPKPGGQTTGVIDIAPGRYFLFDPFSGRTAQTIMVNGTPGDAPEPASNVTVTLREMEIVFPDAAFTTRPLRWKIENTGAMSHEVAIVPVPEGFTDADFKLLMSLPEDATPPPDVPAFEYQPVAAIGILGPGHTSWLDVHLAPGHYLGACMIPFGTGYPHAMDGMYHFFDIR